MAKTIVKYGFKYRNELNVNGLTNSAMVLGQPHGGPILDELTWRFFLHPCIDQTKPNHSLLKGHIEKLNMA